MKRWYKILLIGLMLVGIVALSACAKPAKLTSEMTVEEDGSGKRTIQIELDKNLIDRGSGKSQNTLEHLMDQYCPKELDWNVGEEADQYHLTVNLTFDTLEEYVQKAESLVGKHKIRLENTGEGLSVGFSLEEDVNAEDFLGWMKDALVKEKYIKRNDKDDSFELEKTYFSYAGERQVIYNGKIRYQTKKDYDLEQLVLLTEPGIDAQWNRVIYLKFPSNLMRRAEEQVHGFINARASEGTQVDWLSQECVCLTFPTEGIKDLSNHMELFFGQSTCKIKETLESKDVFSFNYKYEEFLDVKDFAPKTGKVPVYYYVKNSSDGNMKYRSNEQDGTNDRIVPDMGNGELQKQIEDILELGGYQLVLGQSLEKKSILYNMDYNYNVKSMDVSSIVRDSTSISRSITVLYDGIPVDAHKQIIEKEFENKTGEKGYVEVLEEKGEYGVRVSQEGTWEELKILMESVFDGQDQVSYKRDKTTLLTPSANGYMEEKLDFSSFLPEGCEPQLTYSIQFESGDVILKDTLDSTAEKMNQEQVIQSRKYRATVSGSDFFIQFRTEIQNLISMPLIALFGFMIIAVIIWYLHGERWKKIMAKMKPIHKAIIYKFKSLMKALLDFSMEKKEECQNIWREVILKIKSKFKRR